VCAHTKRQWKDGDERVNTPERRRRNRQDNHANDRNSHEGKRPAEGAGDAGDFFEEGVVGGFFGGGTPLHVDGEEVAEEGLGDVQGDAAEEDCL